MTISKIRRATSTRGKAVYALLDIDIDGYLTWTESKPHPVGEVIGVLLFTKGELAEEYVNKVMPAREGKISVCKIGAHLVKTFVKQMLSSHVDYALVDVPPIAVDENAEGEAGIACDFTREYVIVDMKKLSARFY